MPFSEKTIAGIFFNRAERYQYETFLRHKVEGKFRNISWNETRRMVREVGLGLIDLGVQPGDVVGIFSENCWQWVVSDLAALAVGAVDAPIYATNSGEEAAYIVNDSGTKIVFISDSEHFDRFMQVRSKMERIEKIVVFEPVDSNAPEVITFEELMQLGEKAAGQDALEARLEALDPKGVATLIYTSGTTGPPKGVMLTHANIVANVFQGLATHVIDHTDEALNILPWSHSLGRTVGLYLMLTAGAVISLAESFATVLEDLQAIRPTAMVSVPRLFEKLYAGILSQVEKAPPLKKNLFFWSKDTADRAVDYLIEHRPMPLPLKLQYQLAEKLVYSKLRAGMGFDRSKVFINGGGALAVEIDRYFNGVGIALHNGYGLTETSPVTHANTFEVHVFGSVGPAFPDTEVKIAEDGEILLKGPQVMKGYHNQPEATEAVFDADGWLLTGDIGFIDEKECLHITDRKKDIIITAGGKNVAPQNIENSLVSDLMIEQAVVIGEGRKYLSALIVPNFSELAVYAKEQGISFDSNEDLVRKTEVVQFYDEKIKHLMKDFARVEQLRKFTLLPAEFSIESGELTPTLKMKRKVIGDRHKDVIEAMYQEG